MYPANQLKFQSLFFWMLLSKTRVWCRDFRHPRFQSLFFWMLLSKHLVGPGGTSSTSVGFNPYFSGCFSLSYLLIVLLVLLVMCFNPYFSGCFSLRYRTKSSTDARIARFNPYFSGCFSLRRDTNPWWCLRLLEFQSLFFWMLLSKRRRSKRT